MHLPPLPLTVLDTETTGFVPRVHHIIEFASMRCDKGKMTDTYETLLSVTGEIPPHVQVLTRIRPEMIASQPTMETKKEEVMAHIGADTLLVGQNLGFDLSMLKGDGIDLTDRDWIDTSMLASLVFPEFESYSLGYMSAVLQLNHEPMHRALGDVRATLELLSLVWERLLELDSAQLALAKEMFSRVGGGYATLFNALPDNKGGGATWIAPLSKKTKKEDTTNVSIEMPANGIVDLREESLDPSLLQKIINTAANGKEKTWIAVKNLEAQLRRINLPSGAMAMHPRQLLLDPIAAHNLSTQLTMTAEEALLCLKLAWFHPRTREELALHGGEKDIWNGKLACTDASAPYVAQFETAANVFLIDHRQFLTFLAHPEHIAHRALNAHAHIIIDDASMLEDTATKAYGHYCAIDDLRAAAKGDKALTGLTDLLNLWIEQIRRGEDIHHITRNELDSPETKGLRAQLDAMLTRTDLPAKTREQLHEIIALLAPNILPDSMLWIECRMNGSVHMHSAPPAVDLLLDRNLYDKYRTTLLVPRGYTEVLPEIVPQRRKIHSIPEAGNSNPVTVSFPDELSLKHVLQDPPEGKTVVLAGSKRVIEQLYIDHAEALETKNVTLICQGMSGGQGRMEAEFIAAEGTTIWIVTPWTYEGIEVPLGSVRTLIIESLPFDHPNQPVFARRKDRHQNGFEQYALPRLEARLFRLLRTFCRQRVGGGEVLVLDKRMKEKSYGNRIRAYLYQFGDRETVNDEKKQMKLFE